MESVEYALVLYLGIIVYVSGVLILAIVKEDESKDNERLIEDSRENLD